MAGNTNQQEIGFTVDAALILRLGYELVGKAETAVSELIKNAYDADARLVEVNFVNTDEIGKGYITICDNGSGMTFEQLRDGFMRISSDVKVRNPISPRYHRTRAGKKGIGRFATQRLGDKLTIITQTADSEKAIKLVLDWNLYKSGLNIADIKFPIEYVPKSKKEGTDLRIDGNRDTWNLTSIRRVSGYVSNLFEPDYRLTENEKGDTFNYLFKLINDNEVVLVNSPKAQIEDKALATFEGYINQDHTGHIIVHSDILKVEERQDLVDEGGKPIKYEYLDQVKFKTYYFIYNRPEYYREKISSQELKEVNQLSKTASGIKLYRNGFRVLPYGEATNDWTNLNHRWSSEETVMNLPLSTRNLFGFVELIDKQGKNFDETSSREGLIENEAFHQLTDFMNKAIAACRRRLASSSDIFKKTEDKEIDSNADITQLDPNKFVSMREKLDNLYNYYADFERYYSSSSNDEDKSKYEEAFSNVKGILGSIEDEIDEIEMLRVLAGLGLTIGEFTHEVKQFKSAVYGDLVALYKKVKELNAVTILSDLQKEFDKLFSYTKYFDVSISQNEDRTLKSINLIEVVDSFDVAIKDNRNANSTDLEISIHNYDLMTVPMHEAEWSSILTNLYTNSVKAIRRAKVKGKIKIDLGREGQYLYLRFQDNGDGIPKENKNKIFNAFFTTSTPARFDAPDSEQLSGTGLGLKIVKDILLTYKGNIYVDTPDAGYSTCIKVIIPKE